MQMNVQDLLYVSEIYLPKLEDYCTDIIYIRGNGADLYSITMLEAYDIKAKNFSVLEKVALKPQEIPAGGDWFDVSLNKTKLWVSYVHGEFGIIQEFSHVEYFNESGECISIIISNDSFGVCCFKIALAQLNT